MNFQEVLNQITPTDEAARAAAHRHWDGLAKPLGSLGLLEQTLEDIAALTGEEQVHLNEPVLLVYCADNDVIAQGVTQSDATVTDAVARALGLGESTVCHMAKVAGCRVLPVDVGILDFPGASGVLDRRVRNGTADITQGPAMTREECIRAIETGMDLVKQWKNQGTGVILTGEMGIGNTTTSSAVASVLLNVPPETVTGRGAGLSDQGLQRKIAAIRRAIAVNQPDVGDPVDILQKVGGLDLAAICGTFLGGALYKIPIVIDGFISSVAALCAMRLCPNAKKAMVASHVSAEPAGKMVLDALDLKPIITAEMRLGEGSGAVAVLPLLQMALSVYHSGQTFDHLGIDAYTPQ